jgi:hypothetical protein
VPDAETSQLKDQIAKLRSGIEPDTIDNPGTLEITALTSAVCNPAPQVRRCEICERIKTTFFEFLCHYQRALVIDSRERARFVANGGFCAPHMWLYESMAAPRDICVALSPLLMSLSAGFRRQAGLGATDSSVPASPAPCAEPACQLCTIQRDIESEAVSTLATRDIGKETRSKTETPTLCIPHLRVIAGRIENPDLIRTLLANHSHAIDRLAEDMRRYALKYDGLRRWLMSEEERRAPDDALACVAGRRSIIR